jgi:hypothetical protein
MTAFDPTRQLAASALGLLCAGIAWTGACQGAASTASRRTATSADQASNSQIEDVRAQPRRPVKSHTAQGVAEPPSQCELPEVRTQVEQQLYALEDYRAYLCMEAPCTRLQFAEQLSSRERVLREAPRTIGCIFGPVNEPMTRMYAVMVLRSGVPSLALVFSGSDIDVDASAPEEGFRDLVGVERTAPGTWLTHRYRWFEHEYLLKETTPAEQR